MNSLIFFGDNLHPSTTDHNSVKSHWKKNFYPPRELNSKRIWHQLKRIFMIYCGALLNDKVWLWLYNLCHDLCQAEQASITWRRGDRNLIPIGLPLKNKVWKWFWIFHIWIWCIKWWRRLKIEDNEIYIRFDTIHLLSNRVCVLQNFLFGCMCALYIHSPNWLSPYTIGIYGVF